MYLHFTFFSPPASRLKRSSASDSMKSTFSEKSGASVKLLCTRLHGCFYDHYYYFTVLSELSAIGLKGCEIITLK